MAQLIDGVAIAAEIKAAVKQRVDMRQQQGLAQPGLDVILVGNNPASASYVKHKIRACEAVGVASTVHRLDEHTTQDTLSQVITECNNSPSTHGILLQLPLPDHLNSQQLLSQINDKKDVDGFHPINMGKLVMRQPQLRPCTPRGIITLLEHIGIDMVGANAVIVGASNIVGRPMALELLMARSTPTICHSRTKGLQQLVEQADIVVAATGKPGIVQGEWIKPGAVVIDVGFTRLPCGTITGDIDFATASQRASWITPVPGGVGPMTVATLMQNTLQAAELQDAINLP